MTSPHRPLRILFASTYYRPYVSGPIVYVEALSTELVARGHSATILTTRHDRGLEPTIVADGVTIRRAPIIGRLSKGVIAPSYTWAARQALDDHDILVVQIPQLEAAPLVALARRAGVPTVITYHCDVTLPSGPGNRVIERVLDFGHRRAVAAADRVVVYTDDYADYSRVLRRCTEKRVVIGPPVADRRATPTEAASFRERHRLGDGPVVGISARLSAEKGFDRLLAAVPALLDRWPDLSVVHAGDTSTVPGEAAYRETVDAARAGLGSRWRSVGVLHGQDLAAFYAACDVTVLPSVNGTEAFGLVQIESMLNATPVIASDLPGVRVPIQTTGMGIVIPTEGVECLTEAIATVLTDLDRYRAPRVSPGTIASVPACVDGYEAVFRSLVREAGASNPAP